MYRKLATGVAALAMTGFGTIALATPAHAVTKPPCRINGGGHYPPGLCKNASVTQSSQSTQGGGTITFGYKGLKPGTTLTVGSTTYRVGADGRVTATLQVPCSARGTQTVTATGTADDGNAITFTSTYTATPCSAHASGGGLPFTGDNTAVEGAAALGLLGVGSLAVVAGRRRRVSA